MTKRNNLHYFSLARIVLETETPLSIASGEIDSVHDNLLTRDANGLPAIPGSSLAGVLRHLYEAKQGEEEAKKLFGTANEADGSKGHPSRIYTSWGCIHDSNNNPIQGLLDPQDKRLENDPILQNALQAAPIKRDHVKLNTKGVAETQKMGKFDRVSLTAGHRFSIELSLWSDQQNDPRWQQLLKLMNQPNFRLGGKTRSGLGQLAIISCYEKTFDLKQQEDFKKFSEIQQDLSQYTHLQEYDDPNNSTQESIKVTLHPEPEGYRIGSGIDPIDEKSPADLVTITESKITWKQNQGELTEPQILIPASGIKGALRHRTAYYYQLLNPESHSYDLIEKGIDRLPAIEALFGYTDKQGNETLTCPGNILINDIYLPIENKEKSVMTYAHNSIDRFTGGVREGMLYFEEVVTQKTQKTPLEFTLTLLNKEDIRATDPDIIKSLEMAITDLTEERLPLGAGSGRSGTGYFTGTWAWEETTANTAEEGVAA